MIKYQRLTKKVIESFEYFKLQQIEQDDNTIADSLSKLATSDLEKLEGAIYLEHLEKQSIEEGPLISKINIESSWATHIISYLQHGVLPSDSKDVRSVKAKSARLTESCIARGFMTYCLKTLFHLRLSIA